MLLREIHRASECALQCPQRPIDSRGEAKLVSPRDFQKVNLLIICVLVNFNSRGEFHEAPPYLPGFCSGFGDLYYAVFRCCAVGQAFLRDRSWVAVAPEALAKSRSERSASCLAAPLRRSCCFVKFTARANEPYRAFRGRLARSVKPNWSHRADFKKLIRWKSVC